MSKFKKTDKFIEISEIKNVELLQYLKMNVQLTLVFKDINNSNIDFIILEQRLNKGNELLVKVKTQNKEEIMSYDKLINIISKEIKFKILSIVIDIKVFKLKEELITLAGKINSTIIDSCVFIDFENDIFSIVNPDKNGLSDKLYYFSLNNSVLAFTSKGPILIYDKFTGVEDVFCK